MITESDILIDGKRTNLDNISFTIYKKPGLYKGLLQSLFISRLKSIGNAALIEMPACSGIAILTNVFVEEKYRNQGVGKIIVNTAIKLAEADNYSKVMATVNHQTPYMHKILISLNFRPIDEFKNHKTDNTVTLYSHEN